MMCTLKFCKKYQFQLRNILLYNLCEIMNDQAVLGFTINDNLFGVKYEIVDCL